MVTASPIMANHEAFINTDLSEFAGKWIAIVDSKVVASSDSPKEVMEKAANEYPGKKPLIARAPTKHLLILAAGKK